MNTKTICSARPLDVTIGCLDRLLSEFLIAAESEIDEADRQTLKHHADDLIGVGNAALKKLGFAVDAPGVVVPAQALDATQAFLDVARAECAEWKQRATEWKQAAQEHAPRLQAAQMDINAFKALADARLADNKKLEKQVEILESDAQAWKTAANDRLDRINDLEGELRHERTRNGVLARRAAVAGAIEGRHVIQSWTSSTLHGDVTLTLRRLSITDRLLGEPPIEVTIELDNFRKSLASLFGGAAERDRLVCERDEACRERDKAKTLLAEIGTVIAVATGTK